MDPRKKDEEQKQPDLEEKIKTDLDDATRLPAPLVSIVRGYMDVPTSEMIEKVNRDLRALFTFSPLKLKWNGIEVSLLNSMITDIYFNELKLDGIIFTMTATHGPKHLMENDHQKELEGWYKLQELYKNAGALECRGVSFTNTSLRESKFENIVCSFFAFIKKTDLTGASFRSSLVSGAYFSHVEMTGADFTNCDGNRYNFPNRIFKCVFSETNLTAAKFYQSRFFAALFFETIFDNADLGKGVFKNAEFSGCSLQNANLVQTNFKKTDFHLSRNSKKCDSTGANATGANFSGATLESACFDQVKFLGAKFKETKFFNVSLKNTHLQEAGFHLAHFENSDLTDADATGADFTKANFVNTKLVNVTFHGAHLEKATFDEKTDLSGAKLSGAHYGIDQFTPQQLLSFYYEDQEARPYINAICEYMEDNKNEKNKHEKGFTRAHALIYSFIAHGDYYDENGKNKLLAGFLLKGKLPNERSLTPASSAKTEGSLLNRLLKVQKDLKACNAPVVLHHSRK
ncbi:MAG TPA: pentapeptide repeat-containing protein [Gammaproteobacteria bacterium]|nr:pentapeptide repeat-containing protein [Gammaproteobacteria bacterium]